MKKRILALGLMITMILTMSIVSPKATASTDSKGNTNYNRYYYDQLDNDAYKDIYNMIVDKATRFAGSSNYAEEIASDDGSQPSYYIAFSVNIPKKTWEAVSSDGISIIIDSVLADNPIFFWMSGKYTYEAKKTSNENVIYDLKIQCYSEYADSTVRKTILNNVNMGISTYGKDVPASYKDYEKAYKVHNDIIDKNYYQTAITKPSDSDSWAFTADGIFNSKHKSAVSQGYAKAYKLIMDYIGIPCVYAEGNPKPYDDRDESQGKYMTDGWCYILLDNEWYIVSPGLDDPETSSGKDVLTYNYFNVTSAKAKDLEVDQSTIYRHAPEAKGTAYSMDNIKDELIKAGLYEKANYNFFDKILDKYGLSVILISLGVIFLLISILLKRIGRRTKEKKAKKIKNTKTTVVDHSELDKALKKEHLS